VDATRSGSAGFLVRVMAAFDGYGSGFIEFPVGE
jgi:hypothetical protein